MRSPLPPLIDLEAFEAAARHGSFVAAAAELHLTPSAVSHRVKSLERHLGVPLFTRMARRIELTDHGRAYMPSVRKAFEELSSATNSMFGWGQPHRRLTVRVPISYAVSTVAPRLHEFRELHPGIEVRMVSAIWADTMATDDIDIDVRYGSGSWPGHQSELLHTESVSAIWSPVLEAEHGPITDPRQLADLPRVHILGQEDPWVADTGTGPVTAVDTSLAAMAMVATNPCSTVMLTRFAADGLAAGRFVTAPGCTVPATESHWVVAPADRGERTPDAQHFVDWLRANATAAAPPVG